MAKFIAGAIVIAFIIYMCVKIFTNGADVQSAINEKRKELEEEGLSCSVFLRHLTGFDFPVGAFCTLRCFPKELVVGSSNVKKSISKTDIEDAFITNAVDMLKEENKDKYGEFSNFIQNKYSARTPKSPHNYLILKCNISGLERFFGFEIIPNRKTDKLDDVKNLIEQCKVITDAPVKETAEA